MDDCPILPKCTNSDGKSLDPDQFDRDIDGLELDMLDGAAFEFIVSRIIALPSSCVDEQHKHGITRATKARSGAVYVPVCAGSSYVAGPATTITGSLKTSEHRRQTARSPSTLIEAEKLTEGNVSGLNRTCSNFFFGWPSTQLSSALLKASRSDVGAAALRRLCRAVGCPRAEGGGSTAVTPRGRK